MEKQAVTHMYWSSADEGQAAFSPFDLRKVHLHRPMHSANDAVLYLELQSSFLLSKSECSAIIHKEQVC